MRNNLPGPATIDEYIAGFPVEIQQQLQQIREVIKEAAPEASEKISYQMPTFFYNGNLVHFAVQKHHIGFYPAPSGIERFKEELLPYKTSKGAAQFPLDQPIPFELIRKITAYRYHENMGKKNKSRAKVKNK